MNKTFLKATIGLTLFSAMLAINTQHADAKEATGVSQLYADTTMDISQGWKVDFKTNYANVHGEDVFKQNVKSPTTPQKMVINNFANIGNAELTATKTIPMKKGHTYNLDLIYAMQFSKGSGSIDFNGEKVDSESVQNDAEDHSYKKVVKPTADMDYVITIHYKVPMRANGYLKLAYDSSKGNGIDDQSTVSAPVLNAPFEKQTKITGTGTSGNTVEIYDAKGNLLGSSKVNAQNNFEVTVNRPFVKGEEITGYQIDKNGVMSAKGTTTVQEVVLPSTPQINNKITDKTTTITGKADPDTTINIKIGDEEYETTTDADGNFSVDLDHSFPFDTDVKVTAKDKDGYVSDPFDSKVGYDDEATIEFDYTLSSIDQWVSGTSSRPNTNVEIKVGSRIFNVMTDADGNYELELPTTYKPGTSLQAKLTDEAGTTAIAKQIILPRMPTLTDLIAGTQDIFGVVDPNAVVKLTVNHADGTSHEFVTTADANGNYHIKLVDEQGNDLPLAWQDKVFGQASLPDLNLDSELAKQDIRSRSLN
jgi:hypothetical protein